MNISFGENFLHFVSFVKFVFVINVKLFGDYISSRKLFVLGSFRPVDLVNKSCVGDGRFGVVFRKNIGEISVNHILEVKSVSADDSVDNHSNGDFSEGGEFVDFVNEWIQKVRKNIKTVKINSCSVF